MCNKKMPTEIYSRVVGYFRPLNQWNKGKQDEFWNRKTYSVNDNLKEITNERVNKSE